MKLFKPYDTQAKDLARGRGTTDQADSGSGPASAAPTRPGATKKATASGADPTPAAPAAAGSSTGASTAAKTPSKKAIPTPTRRQAEQARRDRIQPVLTRKESKSREREARYKARNEAMAKSNARPYNTMIRNWIDRRWNMAEIALPAMLILFVITIVGSYLLPTLMLFAPYVIWAVVLVLVIDTIVMWVGLRKQLKLHFPGEPLKGKLSYAISRSMLMRRSRQPAPTVKRGAPFVWPPQPGQS